MSSYYSVCIAIALPFLFSLFCAAAISKMGHRLALIDNPNIRSSHSLPTPRGGGIGLWIIFVPLGIILTGDIYFTLIAGAAGLTGFLEDIFTLSSKLRLFIQVVMALLIIAMFSTITLSITSAALLLFWVIFIAGTANFYNFMDGINGIAGLTGVVGFGLIAYYSYFYLHDFNLFLMSIILVAGCLGFLPYNLPHAKVFMGDVGSIFLGFVFASFVIKLSATISIFLCLIMFLFTFYADSIVTIFFRWRRGENLLQAHRCHLYQYLSNELKIAHWKVSIVFALIQLVSGIAAIAAFKIGLPAQILVFAVFSIPFVVGYTLIKNVKPESILLS